VRFFDISVVASGTTVIDGRVWSQAWQFGDGNNSNCPNASMYIYANDGIVTRLNINGWNGGHFFVNCNQWGATNTGNWSLDRMSFDYGNSTPPDYPQYKEFLNPPDELIYPTGTLGQICPGGLSSISYCDGSVDFLIKVTKSGIVTLNIVTPIGTATVTGDVTGYTNCSTYDTLHWNGMTTGGQVQNGASITMSIEYLNGLTNLPCNDIEASPQGIQVDIVRPISGKLGIMWDDTNIPIGGGGVNSAYPGCIYTGIPTPSGCHNFNDGDSRIINSWWYYLTTGTESLNIVVINAPATPAVPAGPVSLCQGQSGAVYTIPALGSATLYEWYFDGVPYDTTATPSTTINIGNFFPTGNHTLAVRGYNPDCLFGPFSPIRTITVLYNPSPVITGSPTACNTTQTSFAATTGLTSYSWSATGGTVVGSPNLSSATFLWNASGTQTVSVITSSVTCPAITTTRSILINPSPVVNFSFSNNCQAQPVQFTDLSTITSGSIVSWNWDFGDGNSSTSPNPQHTYANAGTFNVILTATSDSGCVGSLTLPVNIVAFA
ncbi:MAG TPA: PKD domain-containing protein, partial [Bacteroidales bacterium]|nr:PKD domain-containing protein [Bacteroidales bacterium]